MRRALALVFGAVSVVGMAQVAVGQGVQGLGATPPPSPAAVPATLKMATADTVSVPANVLQGLAENEPDIAAPESGVRNGDMWLRVLVSKTGAVEEVTASRVDEALRQAAMDGVMGWSYRPYVMNGEAREIQSTMMLSFHDGVGKRAVFGVAGGPPVVMPRAPGSMGPVRVSAGVVAGQLEQSVAPVYPPIARAAHVQGFVVLHAILSKTGEVENLQVISGPPMLTAAAEDAVRRWKYRPYLLNGVPTEVETTINVNFTLAAPPKRDAASGEISPAETPDPK